MFWRNLLKRVSKWFNSAKKMVQESVSAAYAKLRGFVAVLIAKIRHFFVLAFLKLRGFVVATVAKIRKFFVTAIANLRKFFSIVDTLNHLVQKLHSLINDIVNVFNSELALSSRFFIVPKIIDQLGDVVPIVDRLIKCFINIECGAYFYFL